MDIWTPRGPVGGPKRGPMGPLRTLHGTIFENGVFWWFYRQSWLQISQDDLIWPKKNFSPALMYMWWGPIGLQGSKGPYFGPIWNNGLFTDFSSKLDANLPIYVNFDWKIFSTNYSNRSQGPICKKNLLTTYLKFSITRVSWFLVLSCTIDRSSKILSDDTWRTKMKHDNTDRFHDD